MCAGETEGRAVRIETFGCQMNVYDSAAMFGLLEAAGFRRAHAEEVPDVLLLNTCSVREHAEHRVVSRIGELHRRRQEAGGRPSVIGVCGCMAERLGQELLDRCEGVDMVVGVDQYEELPELLRTLLTERDVNAPVATGFRPEMHYVAPAEAYPTNNSHLVTIHKGCDYRCTYCIVPETRGPQREKTPEAIEDEIRHIVARGGDEVTLLGQNVTAYRWGDELDFGGLLQRVAALPGLRRIRFLTGHPRDMSDRLLSVLAHESKLCPALHVPMQSGSDRILRRMKRLYKRADYLRMVAKARELIPDVTFSSDFIVGFPGETEADFQATLEAVSEVGYDQLFSFKYSERPGAPAARLQDDVPQDEKKRRLTELMSVQDEVWERIAAAQVGQRWRVAVEGPARRRAGDWKARTANNRKVLISWPEARIGDELTVQITGFQNTTFRGEPLANVR